jgi:hypothetical protein
MVGRETVSTLAAYIQHYPACAKVLARVSGRSAECSCGLDVAVRRLTDAPNDERRLGEFSDLLGELREAMKS